MSSNYIPRSNRHQRSGMEPERAWRQPVTVTPWPWQQPDPEGGSQHHRELAADAETGASEALMDTYNG